MPTLFNHEKASLGSLLFHEVKLSKDNSVSCAHCHNLQLGGVDFLPLSIGVGGAKGKVNAPTVFNAALNISQFWDGRAATLEDQIDGPLHDKAEMASSWPEVIRKISADKDYQQQFKKTYDGEISERTIKNAIAEFERSLVAIDSPFDNYLRGNENAIGERAKQGYALFKKYDCVACHEGANVGGNMYQRLRFAEKYFAQRGNIQKADLGRFNVTGNEEDKYVFKVPSLRMAALTPPYFHDGSVDIIEDAVRVMVYFQLGVQVPEEDVDAIVAFLHSLIGKYHKLE